MLKKFGICRCLYNTDTILAEANLPIGYTMASKGNAYISIEPLNIEFQEILADEKKWHPMVGEQVLRSTGSSSTIQN